MSNLFKQLPEEVASKVMSLADLDEETGLPQVNAVDKITQFAATI